MAKDPLDTLKEQLINSFKAAAEVTASQLNFELALAYSNAIESFYNSYIPEYYKRTGMSYYGSDLTSNTELIYNPEFKNNKYIANINISEEYFSSEKPYRADTDWVFERTFMEGIHGIEPQEMKEWGKNKYWFRRNLLKDKKARSLIMKSYKKYYDSSKSRTFDEWMTVLTSKKRPGYKYGQQYKKYGFRYGEQGISYKRWNNSVAYGLSKKQRRYIEPYVSFGAEGEVYLGSGNTVKSASIHNRYLASWNRGGKVVPNDLLFEEYKKMRKPSNIKKLIEKNLMQKIIG